MWPLLFLLGTVAGATLDSYVLKMLDSDTDDQLKTATNTIASPHGLWALMNCLASGAAAKTLKQIQNAFQLPRNTRDLTSEYKKVGDSLTSCPQCVNITGKNYIFYDTQIDIKSDYKNAVESYLDGTVLGLDFKKPNAADLANNEVKQRQNLTTQAFDAGDFEGSMVVANIITFNAAWRFQFEYQNTKVMPFYDEEGRVIGKVNMMHQTAKALSAAIEAMGVNVLEMPYGAGDKFSMVLIVPTAGQKLANISKKLSFEPICKALSPDRSYAVDIQVPRFKIETLTNLESKLMQLGVKDMFGSKADFSLISHDKLRVSRVKQSALIEVTETGTKAEAVTTAVMPKLFPLAPPERRSFVANKPFLFFIIAKDAQKVLFEGVYSVPNLF